MLISFLFLHENICCGEASNEYPQHMFSWRNKKNIMWIPSLICSYERLRSTSIQSTLIIPTLDTTKFIILTIWLARKPSLKRWQLIRNWPGSVAHLDGASVWKPGGCGFNPRLDWQHSFLEIDHEIFSTDILSFPLIQEGRCQFLAKECAQYWLTA